MRIARLFTDPAGSPYDGIQFRTGTSEIRNPDGSIVFRQDQIEVPVAWTQVACDVLAQKYFRKAGIPACLVAVPEEGCRRGCGGARPMSQRLLPCRQPSA